jgi:CubicO group peptidase (beta-lactamase class C family)
MRGVGVLLKIGLVVVLLVLLVRVVAWVRLRARPDPAARVVPVAMGGERDGTRDLHDLLEPIRARHKTPGLVGAIVRGEEVTAIGAAGVRRAGGDAPVTINDRFHLGSDTKAMTATLIAMLVEEGKLSWGTTVGEVFGADVKQMDGGWKAVRLEQLLTHRAGAPADLNAGGLWGRLWAAAERPGREQRRMLVEGVVSRPPVHAPGTKYLYSNAGYAIAGAMAERVMDRAWEDLMRERLFAPLGMASAGFGAPGTKGTVDEPLGHRANGSPVEVGVYADNPAAIGPGGTVHCTMGDWARFVALHVEGDRGRARLLKADTFTKLHTPAPGPGEKYAMGWIVTQRPWAKGDGPGDTGRVLTHSGSNTMWYAVAWLAPERDFAVIAACNQGGNEAAKACDEAAGAMIREVTRAGAKKRE